MIFNLEMLNVSRNVIGETSNVRKEAPKKLNAKESATNRDDEDR